MPQETENYNGWTNRETWAVGLWLQDGGEDIYKQYKALLSDLRKDGLGARSVFISAVMRLLGANDDFIRDFSGWDAENPPHTLQGHLALIAELNGVQGYSHKRQIMSERAQVVGAAWSKVDWTELIEWLKENS